MAEYYQKMNWTFHQNSCYERILSLEPANLKIMERQVNILWHLDSIDETRAFFNKVLQIDPQGQAWFVAQSVAIQAEVTLYRQIWHYFKLMIDYARPEIADHELFSLAKICDYTKRDLITNQEPKDQEARKLKVGYLSREFKDHSSTRLIWPLLVHHSDQVEVFAYNDAPYNGDIEIQQYFDHWREIYQLDNQTVAERIQADQLDILVDLGGISHASRYGVYLQLAQRHLT